MRAVVRTFFLLFVAVAVSAAVPLVPDFLPADDSDRTAWREELIRLETHLASAYANFQWTVETDSLDLVALHRAADSSLATASNRRAARRAFRELVGAFEDGHLRISPPDHPIVWLAERSLRGSGDPIEARASASSACRRLGFSGGSHGFGLAFDDLPGYVPVAEGAFRQDHAVQVGEAAGVGFGALEAEQPDAGCAEQALDAG